MIDINVLKKLSKIDVLIVEDDELISYALKQSLLIHCNNIYVAKDGLEGYELFEKNKPDVIISDINLPQMNGLEMVKLIHEISPHIPVIIMTSYDNSKNISESINQGAYNYLRKPISIEELQITLLMATKDIYNSQIKLENGFIYKKQSKQLIKSDNSIVTFTKLERDLLHLLICNINNIVEYSTIESYVWEDRSMSIDALRMRIKNIREKTYSHIIENISGCGYRINN